MARNLLQKSSIMRIILFFLLCCFTTQSFSNWFSNYSKSSRIIIMINPAGDAAHAGRLIQDSFERGITLQIAEYLKVVLEERNPYVSVLLTRMPGEIIEPLHNAQCANRISPFLYISLHCYEEKKPIPQMYIYTFSLGNNFFTPTSDLSLYKYDQAHLANKKKSSELANFFLQHMKNDSYKRVCAVKDIISLPFAPLLGISGPAFALEIGLAQKKDWHMIKQALVLSIESVIKNTITIN